MSDDVGYSNRWQRDIGYGVLAYCDHPQCNLTIARSSEYACGETLDGGPHGCGLYFCLTHLNHSHSPDGTRDRRDSDDNCLPRRCGRCIDGQAPFSPKDCHPLWANWKLIDDSWLAWRREHPDEVQRLRQLMCDNNG